MNGLLIATIFLPLLGVVALWVARPLGAGTAKYIALATALITLLLAARVVMNFPSDPAEQLKFAITDQPWLSQGDGSGVLDIRFSLGLDGLGLWMFGLSALLMVTAILVSFEAITDRQPMFYGMLLLLEFGCLGVFSARDIILFYVFFEFTLIPLFFLIGIWGSEDRRYAASKFFLYTLAGSVLTFLGLLGIVFWVYQQSSGGVLSFSIPELTKGLADHPLPANYQLLIFVALFAGFAIKVPLFPLHTWLPLAHVQAPTAGSVILAGILLKIGVYGFLRFSLPMLPDASITCMPVLLWLSAIGIVYGALVALAQGDMKRLIAYSSVSHLGYCTLGLFGFTAMGVQGSVLQMVNHGLSTGGLFAVVGMVYERYHTRQIADLSGLAKRLPVLSFFMLVFTFSSIGLPMLNGFPGELLVLSGMFQRALTGSPAELKGQMLAISLLALSGVVLGAWYMLNMVRWVFFGPLKEPHGDHPSHGAGHDDHGGVVADLSIREICALVPLVVFALWIGLFPQMFLPPMGATLKEATQAVTLKMNEKLGHDSGDPTLPSPTKVGLTSVR